MPPVLLARAAGATALLGALGSGAAPAMAAPVHYVTIVHQIAVARPAATVWARIGHYCDLTHWLGKSCEIVTGKDGEIGAIRRIDHQTMEVLVGRTATSYTYSQPETAGAPTHFYHGTLDVEPVGAGASRIVYTLFYDNGAIADPAARAKELDTRSALFAKAVTTMKTIAEAPPAAH